MAALTAAVVLAAGASSRLGRPKQLVTHRGVTLLRHAVVCAGQGGCGPVVVVLGAEADRLTGELEGSGATVVVNREWRQGLASSIRTGVGVAEAHRPEPAAVMLLACDQPLLTAEVVRSVREAVELRAARLAACGYAGTIGVPAAFDRSLLPELLALSGAGGAKSVLERHRDETLCISWPDGAVDVDRQEDVEALEGD